MDFSIRIAEEKDLEVLAKIEEVCYGDGGYPYFVFRQALDALGDLFFVAERPITGVLGFTVGALQAGREDGWVFDLAVHPDSQGLGVGRCLAGALVDTCFKKGARRIYLHVRPANLKAVELYKSLGFAEIRKAPDYFGPGADRLIMCLDRSRKQKGG